MYCENCGQKIQDGHKFCAKCGAKAPTETARVVAVVSDERWWHRLLKVIYILLYVPLPFILWIVWDVNASTYTGYFGGQYQYEDTSGQAFWYCFLTLLIYLVIIRLIKIATLYIAMGKKPDWRKEFRKLF